MAQRLRVLIAWAALILSVPLYAIEISPRTITPTTDPTELGSLRLSLIESTGLEPGQWLVLFGASYFNQWNGTWHTTAYHRDGHLRGAPITDEELTTLERAFPDDDIYRLDLEGSLFELEVARGFSRGMNVVLRIPWITIGQPRGDQIAEAFHSIFPVEEHYARELFARDQTLLYLRGRNFSILRRQELDGSRMGDLSLSLSAPFRQSGNAEHGFALVVEAPTGDRDTLHGSGGWDVGARWFWSRHGQRLDTTFGAGYTWLDPSGSFLGLKRSHTAHLLFDLTRWIGSRLALHGGARLDTSPLAGITSTNLGEPVLYYRFGVIVPAGSGQWISVDVGEEILFQMGVDADFSLHLSWGWRGGPSALRPRF